jgi:PAS domain S-box-containing protein
LSDSINGGRQAAITALRESEELHRVTLSQISDAVFLTDDAGAFTFICPNVNVIFGYRPDEVQGFGRIAALLGENLFDPAELDSRGEITNIEREIRSKAGDERHLLIHVKSVAIRDSRILYTCRDITERSRTQDALREARLELAHASRLALAGQLTGSIAHEVAQPLTAIIANADAGLLAITNGKTNLTGELREILADIRSEAWLATDVMRRLRALFRKQEVRRQPLDISELTRETLRLIKSEVQRRKVTLSTELEPAPPAVEADRVLLQQVLLNLVFNAMDAMADADDSSRRIEVRTKSLGNQVELSVSDSGHGIPPDRLQDIFEPFVTTKSDGLGLGLVIARSVVDEHFGTIEAENGPVRGAIFRVRLPAMP